MRSPACSSPPGDAAAIADALERLPPTLRCARASARRAARAC